LAQLLVLKGARACGHTLCWAAGALRGFLKQSWCQAQGVTAIIAGRRPLRQQGRPGEAAAKVIACMVGTAFTVHLPHDAFRGELAMRMLHGCVGECKAYSALCWVQVQHLGCANASSMCCFAASSEEEGFFSRMHATLMDAQGATWRRVADRVGCAGGCLLRLVTCLQRPPPLPRPRPGAAAVHAAAGLQAHNVRWQLLLGACAAPHLALGLPLAAAAEAGGSAAHV